MISLTIAQVVEIVSGKLSSPEQYGKSIENVVIDSRQVNTQCLFIAIKGQHYDAHDFIEQVAQNGAVAAIVNRPLPYPIAQIVVDDTLKALGQLAAWVRRQVKTKVVALTGSSGKTSVKELTAQILMHCGQTLYTQGNLNNEIGVPLTLLRLTPQDKFAVIELGANHQGEIDYTTNLVKPHTALVNNVLAAHIEGFGSIQGVAKAKGEIFLGLPERGVAIINADNNYLPVWEKSLIGKKQYFFSIEKIEHIDFYATSITVTSGITRFDLHTPQGIIDIQLPLLGMHNVSNSLAATALAMSVGASLDAVKQGLSEAKPVKGRLYPIVLNEQQTILDDTYNANVGSMIAAAQVLAIMPGYKIMVVGDMGELGSDGLSYHHQVGDVIKSLTIDKVLSVGQLSQAISKCSGKGEHFEQKIALVARIRTLLRKHSVATVLVKGSRSAMMEQVITELQ